MPGGSQDVIAAHGSMGRGRHHASIFPSQYLEAAVTLEAGIRIIHGSFNYMGGGESGVPNPSAVGGKSVQINTVILNICPIRFFCRGAILCSLLEPQSHLVVSTCLIVVL